MDDELLARIDERVKQLVEDVARMREELAKSGDRTTALEKWQWRVGGMALLASLILPIIVSTMFRFAGR